MKILVAYDTSPLADAIIDEIVARPWPDKTEVRLVTVLELPMMWAPLAEADPPGTEKILTALRQEYQRRIEKAVGRLKTRPDLKISHELREPGVKRALLDAIDKFGADLVMAGSHGSSAAGRLFLGSVAHMLVAHAPCNVEIVKRPPAR